MSNLTAQKMVELTAKDWFHITGRGWVAAVDLPEPVARDKLLETYKHVKIDGKEYEVIGFEGWLIHTLRRDVGLLIKGNR